MTGGAEAAPRASVILICRNAAATIEDTLDGLAAQRWSEPWEVVVADNGSTDETIEIVTRHRSRFPSLRIVDASARVGVPAARNIGIEHARGELLLFADSDDIVAPGWLPALAAALEGADLAVARLDFERLNPAWARATRSGHQADEAAQWWFGGEYFGWGYGATLAVRKDWHERVGGLDESFGTAGDDMDYCWRLQEAGARLAFVPDAVVHYRLRTTFRGLLRQAVLYGESWPVLYKRHRPRGLPPARRPSPRVAAEWLWTVRHLALVHRKDRRARLVWEVGTRVGMIRGNIRARTLLL